MPTTLNPDDGWDGDSFTITSTGSIATAVTTKYNKSKVAPKHQGWVELTNLEDLAKAGYVICLDIAKPEVFCPAHRFMSFYNGHYPGYVLREEDNGSILADISIRDRRRRRARIWRRKPAMNSIYSKPLPLP